ncbi:hypothetical protein, partial [Intestinimonas sp. HCP28S3_D6]|uniref:hypothetical protein n=1 Tax=Intestinimonas sp. HCP28S3_D6 TaxID=3438942 RepID=UPI003F8A8992
IHEHEALGGGSGRRLYCRLTSFSRSLQIILRINLDGTDIPSKRCYFCRKGGSSLRRSRLKIFLLYFAPQFSVYTKFGIDPPPFFLIAPVRAAWCGSASAPADTVIELFP